MTLIDIDDNFSPSEMCSQQSSKPNMITTLIFTLNFLQQGTALHFQGSNFVGLVKYFLSNTFTIDTPPEHVTIR